MSAPARWRDRIYESIGLKEWKYDRLDQTDNPDLQQPLPNSRQDAAPSSPVATSASASASASSWPRNKVIKVGALVFAVFVFLVLVFRPSPRQISSLIYDQEARSAYFYLVLPAAKGNADFCKTVFSAAALDYPTPRILNWDTSVHSKNVRRGNHGLSKIRAIHDLLQELGDHTDNDLMMIADGYETWFQLRPSVVIERYYSINERANKRLAKKFGSSSNITQRIVFAAQKRCTHEDPARPECSAVPESELPKHIYGSKTDQDEGNGFGFNRERYLNSGTIVGHVGDLRKLFKDAAEYAKGKDSPFKTDADVLARLFGEQEAHRKEEHQRRAARRSLWKRWLANDPRDDKPTSTDYGIGLDYFGEISQPAEFASGDAAWVLHNSTEKFQQMARRAGVPIEIPPEVAHSTPPYWTPDYTGFVQAPVEYDWSQVPLFTNLWTGVAPAAIQLRPGGTWGGGAQQIIPSKNPFVGKTWDQAWFLPYLRQMLVAKARAPRMPHAVVRKGELHPNGTRGGPEEWWGPDDSRGGVRIETGNLPGDWKSWSTVCGTQEVAEEVLADGRGPWANPGWMLEHDNGIAHEQLKHWFNQWWAVEDGKIVWGEKLP
ncbi:hypothetical protein SLS62_004619 [Diatrype stigma]|uniref:Uncharacterized protein n=1 Tax=Diatrype stigma TaxID=117547 RepID=A0AAN9V2K0_9PEZI